jgi:hypothetical protein
MMGQRLVLKSKKTGKIASRKDQGQKALTIKAQQLFNQGFSGGITDSLLPQSLEEQAEIQAINDLYQIDKVKTRRGRQSRQSDKARLAKALQNDCLIIKLLEMYFKHIGRKRAPHITSVKAFIRWLKGEITRKNSAAFTLISIEEPILLNVERGYRWWADAFAQRKKRRVKDK